MRSTSTSDSPPAAGVPARTTLAILAGGEGRRMGTPKALLTVHGQPLLRYLLDRLRWPGPTMLITAPGIEHPPGCDAFDHEFIDPQRGLGPLRGVLTALEHLATPLLLVITCDMPNIEPAQAQWLLEKLDAQPGLLGVMCRRPVAAGLQVEPFPLALRHEGLSQIERSFASGNRSTLALSKQHSFAVLDAAPGWPETTWLNLNEPDDYARFTGEAPPLSSRHDPAE